MELIVSFQKDDAELAEALEEQFGNDIRYEESKNFDGLDILLTAVIPITAVSVQIVDFILSHFHKAKGQPAGREKRRVLILPNGSIDLRGYTEKEAKEIIKIYFQSQNINHDK